MRLVVLGRDGVINHWHEGGVRSPGEWRAVPGSLGAIARLHFAHFHVVVINNEPGIGTGSMDAGTLVRINERMVSEVAGAGGRIDAILYCPHRPDEGCPCRLPGPGLLLELQRRLETDLVNVPMISDSLEGIHAALAMDMRAILVTSGQAGKISEEAVQSLVGVEVHTDLATAVTVLLGRQEAHR